MMAFKTLLAVLQNESDAPRVLDAALPLAVRHGSHLIGVHAEAMPIAYATPMGGPAVDLTAGTDELVRERLVAMEKLFTERAGADGVSAAWRGVENVSGDSALSALADARAADLVIAQQVDPNAPSPHGANVEALMFETGRPVLLLPFASVAPGPVFSRIVLAWNGSREAARAAFDALPFMREAESVEVLTLDAAEPGADSEPVGTRIAAALRRHGVEAAIHAERSGGMSHGEVIENRIGVAGADLLVMGAYGQSRLKEFFFGGVTRTILRSMPVPVLMSR